MAEEFTRECVSVGASNDGLKSVLVVSADEDRVSHRSHIFQFRDFLLDAPTIVFDKNEWIGGMWMSRGGTYYLSEVLGTCYTNASGNFVGTKVTSSKLYKVWGLSDQAVYAVGSNGTYCVYDGRQWIERSVGASVELHAIGGLSENFLICAGDDGFVSRWNGIEWNQLDLPTNAAIRCVHVVNENLIYFGGYGGTCFRLRNNEFEVIETPGHHLYSINEWRGNIYFGSLSPCILRLDGLRLEPFKATVYGADIQVSSEFMFTCGSTMFARFDGDDWKARLFS